MACVAQSLMDCFVRVNQIVSCYNPKKTIMNPTARTYSVLMVDDSDDDRLFMRMALRDNPKLNVLAEVENGEEAIAYLSGKGDYSDRQRYPFPDLVLLDLKMPRYDGFEVLGWLQQQQFARPKVVVLSGSCLPGDVARTKELGADAYHTKAASKEEQREIVQGLETLVARQAA
jgi:CheY-like chemotaxis protein